MVQQITSCIKISVETKFEGSFLKENILHYAFMYFITIENQSKNIVQLLTRHWKISEAIFRTSYINGVGIVGKKPILNLEIHISTSRKFSYITYGLYVW